MGNNTQMQTIGLSFEQKVYASVFIPVAIAVTALVLAVLVSLRSVSNHTSQNVIIVSSAGLYMYGADATASLFKVFICFDDVHFLEKKNSVLAKTHPGCVLPASSPANDPPSLR